MPDPFTSCDEFFLTTLTRIQETLGYSTLIRLVVDAFGMQHPQRSCKSAKSYAAHFTGLCCGVEFSGAESVHAALQRWLNGSVEAIGITRPQEPEKLGRLTLRYIYDADTEAEIEFRIQEWAGDVWAAYADQHHIARAWVKSAIGEGC